MDMGVYLTPVWPLLLLIFFVMYVQRGLWRRRARRGIRNPGFYPSYGSLGIALQTLQKMADPQALYVLEEKDADDVDDDEEGGEDDPSKALHRQLRKIRRGERIERLTIRHRS